MSPDILKMINYFSHILQPDLGPMSMGPRIPNGESSPININRPHAQPRSVYHGNNCLHSRCQGFNDLIVVFL